jgi:ribosome maturation factor RimP
LFCRGTEVKLNEEWLQSLMVGRIEGVELEEAGNRAHRVVRLYVDYPGGVTHDVCALVSEAVGAALDETDYAEGPYSLEVSSPGIERVLKKPAHFAAHVGQKVYVKTFAPVGGQKVWQGVLREVRGDAVVVVDGAHEAEIGLGNVAKAHLVFEF